MLVESVELGGAPKLESIRPGDVITRVEETDVINAEHILKEIRNKKPGEEITVQIFRDGKTLTLLTNLGFGEARIIDPTLKN